MDEFLKIAMSRKISPQDRIKSLKNLLETGEYDINAQDESGETFLHSYRSMGDDENYSLLKFLAAYGANPNIKNNNNKSFYSIWPTLYNIDTWAKMKPISDKFKSIFGRLILSIELGLHDNMNKLIKENKHELNSLRDMQDENGNTLLHIALMKCDDEAVNILLENNLFNGIKNNAGNTALTIEVKNISKKLISLIERKLYDDINKLIEEIKDKELIKRSKCKLGSLQDENGNTLLHIAVMKCDDKAVDILLQNNLFNHIKNNAGNTALAIAANMSSSLDYNILDRLRNALVRGIGPSEDNNVGISNNNNNDQISNNNNWQAYIRSNEPKEKGKD